MRSFAPILLVSGYFIAFAAAQTYQNVNPDDIPSDTRDTWCSNQEAACPLICYDQTHVGASQNDCNPATLQYTCICEDNTTPNLTEYSLTMPFELCQQEIIDCTNNCNGDATCASACATGKKCGATDPRRVNVTTTATATTASQTATGTSTSTSTSTSYNFNAGSMASSTTSSGSMVFGLVTVVAFGLGFFGLI